MDVGVHGIVGTTSIAAAALKKKAEKEEEKLRISKEKALKEKSIKEQAAKVRKATASKKRSSVGSSSSNGTGKKGENGLKRSKCNDVKIDQDGVIVIGDEIATGDSVGDSSNTRGQASNDLSETKTADVEKMIVVIDSDDDLWDDCYHQGMSP